MGLPSYMWSIIDRNVIQRMTVVGPSTHNAKV